MEQFGGGERKPVIELCRGMTGRGLRDEDDASKTE